MGLKKVGKYDVGGTIGQGTFAKVKVAVNTETSGSVAIKVLAKNTILEHKMVHQIKREISIMKIVRHPNIVKLHEVLASSTKIYIILELATGGELFDKIVHQRRLSENESRRYFQQLIDAVDYCHSKGVYHRDLKPENLLLDYQGNLKVSDFGLSALPQKGVGLLRTTCGTPNYVAPEVLGHQGYDGSAADIWSCGVILFVLMAGYLPFNEVDLPTLYKMIKAAEFTCPIHFSLGAKSLIHRILDPNPKTRISIEGIRSDGWFQRNYIPIRLGIEEEVNLDDIDAVFNDIEILIVQTVFMHHNTNKAPISMAWHLKQFRFSFPQDQYVTEQVRDNDTGPLIMNAFEMITLSQGLNLSALFDRRQDYVKRQTRFISRQPANTIVATIEAVAASIGLKVHSQNFKMRLEGLSSNKMHQLAVVLEVFEVAPSLFMVDVRKVAGDTLEYHKFYKSMCNKLESIIWKPKVDAKSGLLRTKTS
ncbi:CBL-interacting protein kinase 24-like isoform X1 [Zingiber officinale]|uniref:CBL-interacting protein kinase 24-like isoform X1 n=1 Tax=Zingiber officinale TaxID=94328 RepID=UPI001C4B4952|nr:CBL-interacting protein kinase 24-like isoform X1 [Zingiber officinale]XP_042424942.1 CBL-interacting protein kinase 24-like isoform X1 [Zingiber officinale]XP_042424943.1 CBL-interacting protein kinase 24-like isoform X1 [Zingiber officinale]